MLQTLNYTISNKDIYTILLDVDTENSDYSSFTHSLFMDEMIKYNNTKYTVIYDSYIAFLKNIRILNLFKC